MPETVSSSKEDWARRKEEQARLRRRQNELKKTEERIEALEARDKEIDEQMTREEVFTDVQKCIELGQEKAELAQELEALYEKWEELSV